jgi:hypothetical protein
MLFTFFTVIGIGGLICLSDRSEIGDKLLKTHWAVHMVPVTSAIPKEGYWFHGTGMLADDTKIPSKMVFDILRQVRKNEHYNAFEIIMRVQQPAGFPEVSPDRCVVIFGNCSEKAKIKRERIGFLFFMGDKESMILGIWPAEDEIHYRTLGLAEVPKQFREELKMLQKPKLWKQVTVFTAPLK